MTAAVRMGRPARDGERPLLTRDKVVRAAVAMAARQGVESISLRALARSLDVSAPALAPHWVRSRDELLDAVVEHVLAGVELPDPGMRWDRQLAMLATRLSTVFGAYRGLADRWLADPSGRAGAHIVEFGLRRLTAAGLDPREAEQAFAAVVALAAGYASVRNRFGAADATALAAQITRLLQATLPGPVPDARRRGEPGQ